MHGFELLGSALGSRSFDTLTTATENAETTEPADHGIEQADGSVIAAGVLTHRQFELQFGRGAFRSQELVGARVHTGLVERVRLVVVLADVIHQGGQVVHGPQSALGDDTLDALRAELDGVAAVASDPAHGSHEGTGVGALHTLQFTSVSVHDAHEAQLDRDTTEVLHALGDQRLEHGQVLQGLAGVRILGERGAKFLVGDDGEVAGVIQDGIFHTDAEVAVEDLLAGDDRRFAVQDASLIAEQSGDRAEQLGGQQRLLLGEEHVEAGLIHTGVRNTRGGGLHGGDGRGDGHGTGWVWLGLDTFVGVSNFRY